MSVLKEA